MNKNHFLFSDKLSLAAKGAMCHMLYGSYRIDEVLRENILNELSSTGYSVPEEEFLNEYPMNFDGDTSYSLGECWESYPEIQENLSISAIGLFKMIEQCEELRNPSKYIVFGRVRGYTSSDETEFEAALKELKDKGFIKQKMKFGKDGRVLSATFKISYVPKRFMDWE